MWNTFVVLFVAAIITGCQKSSPENTRQAGIGPVQKISVAYTSQPEGALVHVAIAKGYFDDESLDVQATMHTFGRAALQSVLENKADFATVAETPVMFSILKDAPIFVIAMIVSSSSNNAVVANKSAGITSLADLKGKRIGFTPGTTSDFFLDSLLSAGGLTRREVQPVALRPEEMQEAISDRKVDAVSTWNYPLTQIRKQLGTEGATFYDREIYTETFNIAVLQDYARKNPGILKRFLRALIKAETFVAEHSEEAQSIVAARTNTDKNLIRDVWSAFKYEIALDQSLVITLEDETRWAMKHNLTNRTAMPDYAGYIHRDALRAAKAEMQLLNR